MSTTDLDRMIEGLEGALTLEGDRISAEARRRAAAVVEKASQRRGFDNEHTVVAFAGSTGSGKSSLFNAVAGLEIATVGARRPTTSLPAACIWGDGGEEVLDWLEVPPGRRTWRESALDADDQKALHGLILLDLPDHDSTEVQHQIESDRLVELVDVLFWVVDPQKYADHALHARYLRPLKRHAEVMVVVLNQVDTLTETEAAECVDDLRGLLDDDGLEAAQLRTASAVDRSGVSALRELLAETVRGRHAAHDRLLADAETAAAEIRRELGAPARDQAPGAERAQLVEAMVDAAGVPAVRATVHADHLRRAERATAHPLVARRVRSAPDPLGSRHEESFRAELRRQAEPAVSRSHRARVGVAAQNLAAGLAEELPPTWQTAIQDAATRSTREVSDTLDDALDRVHIDRDRPSWWSTARFLQYLFFVLTILGAVGLIAGIVATILLAPSGLMMGLLIGIPALVLVVGVIGTLLTVSGSARRRARDAESAAEDVDRQLRGAIEQVADRAYLSPLTQFVVDHRTLVERLRPAGSPEQTAASPGEGTPARPAAHVPAIASASAPQQSSASPQASADRFGETASSGVPERGSDATAPGVPAGSPLPVRPVAPAAPQESSAAPGSPSAAAPVTPPPVSHPLLPSPESAEPHTRADHEAPRS